jgi:hypothetical protein
MMFAEVCNYRPCAEGKPGNVSRWGTALGQQMAAAQAKAGSDSKMDVDSKSTAATAAYMQQHCALSANPFCRVLLCVFPVGSDGSKAGGSDHKNHK